MFTGLIQAVGTVRSFRRLADEAELGVDLGAMRAGLRLGDSVALSGVCCTLVPGADGPADAAGPQGTLGVFRLSAETLARTWFDALAPGRRLNLEPALRVGDPLGGHLVQGHVDGVGRVVAGIDPRAGGTLALEIPDALWRYCVEKGSLCVDGVSLTIAAVEGHTVRIAVIPHTAAATTLGEARVGQAVNLEVDVIGKYVERLLAARFDR
ncbi:MAG: riboflavin synthase [Planctomycetes bacterium]|nr:riboflavin synthase [Planctomycetota bacterium]